MRQLHFLKTQTFPAAVIPPLQERAIVRNNLLHNRGEHFGAPGVDNYCDGCKFLRRGFAA
jgi:hypothetical protein